MRYWLLLFPFAVAIGQPPSFRPDRVLPSGGDRHVPLAPGMLVSIYGENLGPSSSCAANADTLRTETPNPVRPDQSFAERLIYPAQLCGVQVTLAGLPAGLLYVSSRQINFKVPQDAPLTAEAELKVIFQERAGAANVRVGLETTSLSAEGEARVGGPFWIHIELPYGSGNLVQYPVRMQPDDFGCNEIEVRRNGIPLPRVGLRPPAGGIALNGNPCGNISIEGDAIPHSGRLPLHLQYRFTEPGEYEIRYTRRRMEFGASSQKPLLQSEWTPIRVLPRARHSADLPPMPSSAAELLSDYLPNVLAGRDRAALDAVVACLYHRNPTVRQFAASSLAYWPEDEANARVDRELAVRGPSEPVIDGTLQRHPEMLRLVLPYLRSDDRVLLRGAIIGASRFLFAHPTESDAGEALISAAEHVIHAADPQTVVDYAAALGSVRDDRAAGLLWSFVRRGIARGQSLIAITWRKDSRDLPRLAALLDNPAAGGLTSSDLGNLPYALYNGYGDEALPYLESALSKSEQTAVRTNCARELILAGHPSGFAFVREAIEQNRSYRREMTQYLRERFPQLRDADDAAILEFLRTRGIPVP